MIRKYESSTNNPNVAAIFVAIRYMIRKFVDWYLRFATEIFVCYSVST